jgi:hypothetical protein
VRKTISSLLRCVESTAKRLPRGSGDIYERECLAYRQACLHEAEIILRKALDDLRYPSKARGPIYAEIVRALVLAGEGGSFGA